MFSHFTNILKLGETNNPPFPPQSRADAYDYPQSKTKSDSNNSSRYYNGYRSTSPTNTKGGRLQSPHPHSHPKNGTDTHPNSPSNKALSLTSPSSRHRATSDASASAKRHTPTPAPSLPSLLNPEPSTTSASAAPASVSPGLSFVASIQHLISQPSILLVSFERVLIVLIDTKPCR